jgi:hypothetical protein
MTAYTEADLAAELEQSKLHVRISLFCFLKIFLLPQETNALISSLRMMMSHSFGMMVIQLEGFFFFFFLVLCGLRCKSHCSIFAFLRFCNEVLSALCQFCYESFFPQLVSTYTVLVQSDDPIIEDAKDDDDDDIDEDEDDDALEEAQGEGN